MNLEIIGAAVGLLYLWLEYRANIYVWVTGIIMPAIYTVVYYQAGLYADFAINVYYIIAAVYGVIKWWTPPRPSPQGEGDISSHLLSDTLSSNLSTPKGNNISPSPCGEGRGGVIIHTPPTMVPCLVGAFLMLWATIAALLFRFTDSTVPISDAFTTSLSIVAMYMLAHKHAEQWLAWIAVDAVCAGLYIYKELYFTAALYALYTVVAVAGYRKWTKLALPQPSPQGEGASPLRGDLRGAFDAVVLAAGNFPTHPLPVSLLDHPRVVCCDGAAAAFISSGRTPLAVVGDGDSLSPALKSQVRFIHIPDQNSNDLTKAITLTPALSQEGEGVFKSPLTTDEPCVIQSNGNNNTPSPYRERAGVRVAIIGATGLREDHTLGNISLLIEYMRQGLDVTMITDHGIFRPARGTQTFESKAGQQISIFNFSCSRMRNDGLVYQFPPLTNWWMGTLNEATADSFTIEADGDYLIFWAY